MKICLIAEGCYPYVVGGVSGWIHSMVKAFPNVEFVILSIVIDRKQGGKFAYELPENVTQVYEAYLDDCDWQINHEGHKKKRLSQKQYHALRSLVLGIQIEWDVLFDLFQKERISVDDLLMGEDFLNVVREVYDIQFSQIVFSDFLWTMRSIYKPLCLILQTEIPKADIYHCVATGYSGILGGMAAYMYQSGLIISEHGIYTREREEEILKAKWVQGIYKNIWIDQFRKMSKLAYDRAEIVTCLYGHAKELQMELGCPEEKIWITPNGIDVDRFKNIPGKLPEDEGYINIGAVLRVTPIKDCKTMLRAFAFAKEKVDNLRLWMMGPTDEDEEYAGECFDLVETMQIRDVIFTGRINVAEYIGRMDFSILTSISEGQPLTILESFAAHVPVIATDVGNCRELIYGNEDDYGTAGILTHIMNVQEIADAMKEMASNTDRRLAMGVCGYNRAVNGFRIDQMRDKYREIYRQVGEKYEIKWPEETFRIK